MRLFYKLIWSNMKILYVQKLFAVKHITIKKLFSFEILGF